jgi:PAS domain S-box-containing protein
MRKRILVVEDDPVFRNYLYQVLKYDFEVTPASRPFEALNALNKQRFEVMITDLRMPEMEGMELVERVRSTLDPHMPVIVITAFEDDWPMDAALSKHVFRYLRKGAFLPSELKQDVDKAIEIRHSMEGLRKTRKTVEGSKDFYKEILDNSPHAIFIMDTDRKPRFLNKSFQQLTGYGMDTIRDTILDIVSSKSKSEMERVLSTLGVVCPDRVKMVFVSADGSEITLDVWLALIKAGETDSIFAIGSPGTQELETQDLQSLEDQIQGLNKLLEEKTKEVSHYDECFQRIAQGAPGIIVWLDKQCRCTYINPELERLLGYPAGEFLGNEIVWESLLHPDDVHIVDDIRNGVKEGVATLSGEVRAYNRSGYMLFLTWRASIHYAQDGSYRAMDLVAEDITLRKVAEEELRKATIRIQELYGGKLQELRNTEERYRLIVEGSSDMIFSMDNDYQMVYMNRKGLKALGLSLDEILGRPCNEFVSDDFSLNRLHGVLKNLSENNGPVVFPMSVDTREGKRVWSITLGSIGNGTKREFTGVARDITEEVRNYKKLRLLANIEHFSADAIIGLDTDRHIISWNQGAYMMFGWTEDEIIGKSTFTIIPDDKRKEADEVLDVVMEKGFVKDLETRRKTKSGLILDVSLTMTAIKDDTGSIIGFSAIIKDITDQKKMESALVQSERLAATGKLAASIAHEINNPLYGIRSCLNHVLNIEDKNLIDTQFIRLAIKETDRIAELIRNMKTFYMPTEGKVQEIDINEILRDVFAFNRKYLEENKVRLEFREGACPCVQGVPEQLKQVFVNLITNAVEAMPQGGFLTVTTEAGHDDRIVNIIFTDTGVGIVQDDLPRIFEMFYSKKPHVKGVGLGLSVSYGIIKRHGGKIDVESEEGKGSSFKVILPVKTEWGRQLQLDLK